MKIVSDHGFPKNGQAPDGDPFEQFKKERDHINQSGRDKTTVAAMDWAAGEIRQLRARVEGAPNRSEATSQAEDNISGEELRKLFGDEIPLTAVVILLNAAPGLTVAQVRRELRTHADELGSVMGKSITVTPEKQAEIQALDPNLPPTERLRRAVEIARRPDDGEMGSVQDVAERARLERRVTRMTAAITGAIEAIERNSTSAPVLECLKASLATD